METGEKWVVLPPPYNKEDMEYLDQPLPGTYKFATGKGSASKTMQVLGGNPPEDVDVDLGWAKVHISREGNTPLIEFTGGKEAIEERWAEERQEQEEYDRQRLIRGEGQEVSVYGLDKTELPQYRTGNLRVYLVNGEYIRTNIDRDWTQGGHYKVYPKYIPFGELWIERMRDPQENQFTLLHELAELNKMSEGMSYEDAHSDIANEVENKARREPAILDSLIDAEIARYRNGAKPPKREKEVVSARAYEDDNFDDDFGEEVKPAKTAVANKVRPKRQTSMQGLGDQYYLGHKLPPADLTGGL